MKTVILTSDELTLLKYLVNKGAQETDLNSADTKVLESINKKL